MQIKRTAKFVPKLQRLRQRALRKSRYIKMLKSKKISQGLYKVLTVIKFYW